MKNLISLLLLLALLTSCASVPGVKEPTDQEINLQAEKSYSEIKSKSKFSNNKEWNNMVQRVAKRIEATLATLAAVMGHEVVHATLRHGKQQFARAMKGNIAGAILGGAAVLGGQLLCKTQTCKNLTLLGGAASGFLVTFLDRKFSREDEISADKKGQILMAKAGYDPHEAPKLWVRMNEAMGGKAPPEWMSTHPADDRRRENLNAWMSDADHIYQSSPKKSEFLS